MHCCNDNFMLYVHVCIKLLPFPNYGFNHITLCIGYFFLFKSVATLSKYFNSLTTTAVAIFEFIPPVPQFAYCFPLVKYLWIIKSIVIHKEI